MKYEAFGASLPQEGRTATSNQDAFRISREPVFFAVLADGAGAAQLAARKVIALFEKLLRSTPPEKLAVFQTWKGFASVLDSSLLGGNQSTFTVAAEESPNLVGFCVGDSRLYQIDKNGKCTLLTEESKKHRLGSGRVEPLPILIHPEPGEFFLILSDGAWTQLGSPDAIARAFMKYRLGTPPPELPAKLLEHASKTGRADDMTAVVISVKGG